MLEGEIRGSKVNRGILLAEANYKSLRENRKGSTDSKIKGKK